MGLKRYVNRMACVSPCCFREIKSARGSEDDRSMVSVEFSAVSAEYQRHKDSVVSIVLAGGRVELYADAVPAALVMEKYPGLCLARPEVFKRPHDSLVGLGEKLLPGEKFYLVPSTTVKKLKQRFPKKPKEVKGDEAAEVERKVSEGKADGEGEDDEGISEEPTCSAKDYSVSKEGWSECYHKRFGRVEKQQLKKKPITPPVRRGRPRQGLQGGWKPSLTSVKEVSP